MEILSAFKTENQREILTQLLPGSIACWPYAYLMAGGLNFEPETMFSEWSIIPIAVAFLFVAWGVGLMLTDVAANIEVRLELVYFELKGSRGNGDLRTKPFSLQDHLSALVRILFGWILILCKNREFLFGKFVMDRSDIAPERLKEEFYNVWLKYLLVCVPEKQPIILKYYRGVLNRFKFELTMNAALIVMLIGHFIIAVFQGFDTLDLLTTIVYLLVTNCVFNFLFIEAFKGVELLHELRQKIIEACSMPQDISPAASGQH